MVPLESARDDGPEQMDQDQGTGIKVGTPGSRDPEHGHLRLLSLLQHEEWFSKYGLIPRPAVSASPGALLELVRTC